MNFRIASMGDLPAIKAVYRQIVRRMEEDQIQIWDDIYPCEFFEEDIRRERLYIMREGTEIVSAFALCESGPGDEGVEWESPCARALYLDRLGVNVDFRGRGAGALALAAAMERAGALGADYLRLFVVDQNTPAIRLYEKNGFVRARGVYDEVIDKELVLHEYGYEKRL